MRAGARTAMGGHRGPEQVRDERPVSLARAQYERFGQLVCEFAEFGVIGVAGLFITNAVYDPAKLAVFSWLRRSRPCGAGQPAGELGPG
jgi:hypothetical protein